MKIKNLICAAGAALLLLSACSGNESSEQPRTLADYGELTAADSLIYYFGQLRAVDYWQFTYNDSTLRSRESRDQYLKGLRAGLDAARDDDAYNQGLYVGVQIALNIKEFSEEYHLDINRRVLIDAVTDGLANDSAVNAGEANREFRQVLERLNLQKQEADRTTAIETLSEAARAGKWTKISETLYAANAGSQGEGALIKDGEVISVKVVIRSTDGKEIDRRTTERMKVGQGFPGPVTEALHTMRIGEERRFYTTGPEMFGRFAERYKVKPTQVIEFTVSTAEAAPEEQDGESSAPQVAAQNIRKALPPVR